jgi:glutaredoxin 3
MPASITVYTRTSCPYCELVKKFLDAKGARYLTVNMEEDAQAMRSVMSMTGRLIAPTTVIKNADGSQDVIVGFNLARIVSAIAYQGEMDNG